MVIVEYCVLMQNYKVEFDQVLSVVIIVVIKFGGNEIYGNVYFNCIGSNWMLLSLVQKQDEVNGIVVLFNKQIEGGFSIGGVIKLDMLYYFFVYDGKFIDKFCQLMVMNLDKYLGSLGFVFFIVLQQGLFKGQFKEYLLFGKLLVEIDDCQCLDFFMMLCKEMSYVVDGDWFVLIMVINNNNNEYCVDLIYEYIGDCWFNEVCVGWESVKWNFEFDLFDLLVCYKYLFMGKIDNVQDIFFVGGLFNVQDCCQKGIYLKDDLIYIGVVGYVIKGGVQVKVMKYEFVGIVFCVLIIDMVLDVVIGQLFYNGLVCIGINVSSSGLLSDQCNI